jgi:hypothetical protein
MPMTTTTTTTMTTMVKNSTGSRRVEVKIEKGEFFSFGPGRKGTVMMSFE